MKFWVQSTAESTDRVQVMSAQIAAALRPMLDAGVPAEARGLYLATGDAGIAAAVVFWQMALVETPRFASPAEFPWTLANAPASLLARDLDRRGPCYTMVGEADATLAALDHASDDLAQGVIKEALLVASDLTVPTSQSQAAAVILYKPILNLPQRAPSAVNAVRFLMDLLQDL